MAEFSEVGVYHLQERIGRGGMAEVYRADDPRTHRSVAVKLINADIADDPAFRKRFAQEINVIARLEHSGIVPLYDVGEVNGRPYLVMRYIAGETLAERIEAGAIPLEDASRLLTRLAAALDFAHARGIVHRDLKPGNVLMDQEGESYIADFGIAKLVGQSATSTFSRTGMTMGTPAYMSPEQFRGEDDLDGRSDVYALGVLFYHMLAGKLPFDAATPHGLMYQHLESPVPDIRSLHPDYPADLQLVFQQALAKQRDARYPTAGAFARDVQAVVEGKSVTPLPATSAAQLLTVPLPNRPAPAPVAEQPAAPTGKSRLPFLLAGISVVAILLLSAVVLAPLLNRGDPVAPTEIAEESASDIPLPAPVLLPGDRDYLIYSDRLENGFEDWSWAEVGLDNDDPVYEKEYSIWVQTDDYSAAWFVNPEGGVETADYTALHFAIHGGEAGGQILLVGLSHDQEFPVSPHGVFLNDYLPDGPIADTWREVTIPLSDFEFEDEVLYSVGFQSDVEEAQPYFFIDDIRLIAAP